MSTTANSILAGESVSFLTTLDLTKMGGLEEYTQQLSGHLRRATVGVTANGQPPERRFEPDGNWLTLRARLLPLMTRPFLRQLAAAISARVGNRKTRQWQSGCRLAHYIGTGWDLLGFSAVRAARRCKIPITCLPAVHPGIWGDAPLDISLYRRMDAVFVLSDYEREHLIKLGVPGAKLVRCVCGTHLPTTGNAQSFRQRYRLENEPVLLFVGRRTREKGYHALREAVAKVWAAGHKVRLVSIGRDAEPPYPPLPAEVDIDLGRSTQALKNDAYAACDIFVLPSSGESFGIAYLEAWAHHKPVLCGPAPAAQELVQKHNGGLLSNGTTENIAAQISLMLADSPLRRVLAANGYLAVCQHYTYDQMLQIHLDTWSKLLLSSAR